MIRQALFNTVLPDAHRLAPGLNSTFVHQTVQRAVHGAGPLPSAASAADKQLEEQDGDTDKAIRELIENHAALAGGQGFLTNLGGLITMAVMVPANIAGLALLQTRMVAGIAYLRGYDLEDDRVRNAILVCMLGEDTVKSLVTDTRIPGTPMLIATAPAYDPALDKVIAAEVMTTLVNRVVGKRAASAITRKVPAVGGFWGAGTDAWSTWQVGKYARRELLPRARAEALAGRSRWRLRR